MESQTPFFRQEALRNKPASTYGSILLIRPISFSVLTMSAVGVAVLIGAFFFLGTYANRSSLNGQLVPDQGISKLFAPQYGTIVEKRVKEGDHVRKGDVLYVLTSERRSLSLGDTQAGISEQVSKRVDSLKAAISKTVELRDSELAAARKKWEGLRDESEKVEDLVEDLRERVALAEEASTRYENLRRQGYLSQEDLLSKQTDLLDQRVRLRTLERDRISLQRQMSEQQALMTELPLKYHSQIAELERDIASAEQELSESEAGREWVIVAPQDGIVSSVIGENGQTVDSSRPLLSVVPLGAKLQARLYATSKAVGFIKPGKMVYLRYQSFPYQKFGHYAGTVVTVSRTAAPPSELLGTNALFSSSDSGVTEPLYSVTVELESQSVRAYGREEPLQAGMLVDADVLLESRRLFEWVLEPLFTLAGKIH